jgi:hypothetical protein
MLLSLSVRVWFFAPKSTFAPRTRSEFASPQFCNTSLLANMTGRKRRKTSLVVVRSVCARVCAGRRYHLLSRKKGYWVGSSYFCCKVHRTIEDIYGCLGERYFRQAYRMSYKSFWLLHRKLSTRIAKAVDDSRHYKRKGDRGGNYKLPPVRNGPVTTCVWLAYALRYFAGALPYDIMASMEFAKSQCQRVYGRLLRQ